MQTAYLDCFSGVSGDMLLGALLDAGVPESYLRDILAGLSLHGFDLAVERKVAQGFAATKVTVVCEDPHHHEHRHLADITGLLAAAAIPPQVRDTALAVFTRLAEAEAAIHGTTVDAIHFHEVGAVDALVDIVGTVAGFAFFNIDRLVCSPLPLARGWVTCGHGEIPLPGPAVCQLLAGVPVYGEHLDQEMVTPTGAALVRELACDFGPMPPMRLAQIGYGAGALVRSDGRPNLLRLILGQAIEATEIQMVEVIETHLDDWNPEFWPHVSELLLAAGALDVCLIPIQMKKGRPGFLVRVIGEPATRLPITAVLFSETSTIGLRLRREERITLPRKAVTVTTPWGELAAKQIATPAGEVIVPEYEVCRRIAQGHGVPLQAVYAAIQGQRAPGKAPVFSSPPGAKDPDAK